MGLEIELKAGLGPVDAARLARVLGRRGQGDRPERLNAVYHDSADHRLKTAGIALRVRREGGVFVQTVKAGRSPLGGFHQVQEAEVRVAGKRPDLGSIPDAGLRDDVLAVLAGVPLLPWFETRIVRRRWQVPHANGLVEVALDRGFILGGGRRQPVLEAEFELLEGSPEAVFGLAGDLLGQSPACLVLPSKAARGAALAAGRPWSPEIVQSKPVRPSAQACGAEAWNQAIGELALAVAANLDALFTTDAVEGPHQLRVALRRLRAALAMHRPVLDRALALDLATRARALGQMVAPLRDCDVLSDLYAKAVHDPQLLQALAEHRATVRAEVRSALRETGATALAIQLLGLAALGGWQREGRPSPPGVADLAARALDRLWKRTRKLGDGLAALDDEERHELRKLLKKIRYTLEFAPDALARKAFTSRLKRIQEDLGKLNDFSVLEAWTPGLDSRASHAFANAKARLLRASRNGSDLALGRACRHWRELRACERPWGAAEEHELLR